MAKFHLPGVVAPVWGLLDPIWASAVRYRTFIGMVFISAATFSYTGPPSGIGLYRQICPIPEGGVLYRAILVILPYTGGGVRYRTLPSPKHYLGCVLCSRTFHFRSRLCGRGRSRSFKCAARAAAPKIVFFGGYPILGHFLAILGILAEFTVRY